MLSWAIFSWWKSMMTKQCLMAHTNLKCYLVISGWIILYSLINLETHPPFDEVELSRPEAAKPKIMMLSLLYLWGDVFMLVSSDLFKPKIVWEPPCCPVMDTMLHATMYLTLCNVNSWIELSSSSSFKLLLSYSLLCNLASVVCLWRPLSQVLIFSSKRNKWQTSVSNCWFLPV